jgi:hypothetical protein
VTYLDAYGLIALLTDEAAASDVEDVLRAGDCSVVAVNLAEAIDVTARRYEHRLADIRRALEPLVVGGQLRIASSGEPEAWLAAEIRAAEYHRMNRPVSMADCFLLAHASIAAAAVATSDSHVAGVARARGLSVVALPDTQGNRP